MRTSILHAQTQPRVNRFAVWSRMGIFGLLCLLALTACGKRPGQVDAPPGTPDAGVAKVYPNPNTDPKP